MKDTGREARSQKPEASDRDYVLRKPWGELCEAQQKQRERRDAQRDWTVPRSGPEKTERIDLGLALFQRHAMPGVCYTRDEIAEWCGCQSGTILNIEQKALRKLRTALLFRHDPVLTELMEEVFYARTPAQRREAA